MTQDKRDKPFFTGYRPQFYFRTEENKAKFTDGLKIRPKAIEPTAIPSVSGGRSGFDTKEGDNQ